MRWVIECGSERLHRLVFEGELGGGARALGIAFE
jgi:hypothetical protein